MSEHRIILIENPAHLSINTGRLRLSREGKEDVHILPQDIAVLVLHHHTIQLTVNVLRVLGLAGAAILTTDDKHHPSAITLPYYGAPIQSQRLRQQIKAMQEGRDAFVWQRLIQCRIRGQADNLRRIVNKGALRLERMAEQVQPADYTKVEGQAARHYWSHLFPLGESRVKQGAEDLTNIRLNFGYAVLRSLIARELAAVGLNPILGVGHISQENPFNLADDFLECYRYLVERQVFGHPDCETFDPHERKRLASVVQETVTLGKETFRLTSAVTETIASYCRWLDKGKGELRVPHLG
ncbi:MAG: hypothetical protein BWK73_38900 [Thiothrix lacustris]|uniref:CRISPR-associated endonuclease Cas1 n=1 Tax=Thiothrix lacustris TaxID=525917 RepID=A0A1Y1QEA5_9GAMM|nr:MAG: hypothetical protein BWK73_38900 [Thiothrix lacustris]